MAQRQVPLISLLKDLGKDKEAYEAYAAAESAEDLRNYLLTIEGLPKERIPSVPNFLTTLIRALKDEHGAHDDKITNSFKQIQSNLSKILRKNVHPEAALLQNIIISTVDRVTQLADGKVSDKGEMAIARYVSDLRSSLKDLSDMHTSYDKMKEEVDASVKRKVETAMVAVRETVQELFPDKFADFQRLLLSKLSNK